MVPARAARRGLGGWRALGLTWFCLLLAAGAGVGWLAWLGPVPPPPEAGAAIAEAQPAPPRDTAAPAQASVQAPAPAASAPPAPAASPGAAPASAPAATAAPAVPNLEPAGIPPELARGAARPIAPPDPDLLEPGPHGPLPRIGAQGRSAIRAYGRAFDRQDARPRVGLVIGGLGLNAALAEDAIRRLPGAVTLAFSPYAPRLDRLLEQARARGVEVLLALPLEPTGYPLSSPGDRALLTSLTDAENQDRLDWSLSRFQGYVGVIGAHGPMRGERFAMLPDRLAALQRSLALRGLLYVDPRPGAPQPARAWGRSIDILVDEPATRGEIDRKLEALERLARERGTALGYAGEPSPVLVERVAIWAGSVEGRGLVLAPISALIRAPAEITAPVAAQASTPPAPAAPPPAPPAAPARRN